MNPLLELRETRGQLAADRAWQEPRRMLEDLKPELDQLRDELAKLSKPPTNIQTTAERILREWQLSPSDPKALAVAIRNLRSAALGAMQIITEKPAEIEALLGKIESINPATFAHASVNTIAASYRKQIAPLVGNAKGLEFIVDELLRQEQEALALAKQHLEAQQANQGEAVPKQSRTVSTVLSHDDEPEQRTSREFAVLSGTIK